MELNRILLATDSSSENRQHTAVIGEQVLFKFFGDVAVKAFW